MQNPLRSFIPLVATVVSLFAAGLSTAQIAPFGGIHVEQPAGVHYFFLGNGTQSGGGFVYLNYLTGEFDAISPVAISSDGTFSGVSPIGRPISGQIFATSITLTYNGVTVSSPKLATYGPTKSLSGPYIGSLVNNTTGDVFVTQIYVLPNGTVVASSVGTLGVDAGFGTISPGGSVSIRLLSGETVTTSFLPSNGIAKGTLIGSSGYTYSYSVTNASPQRLANISTRGLVGSGAQVLIGGFVVKNGGETVVIRAIGPSLAAFNVSQPLQNPRLDLYKGQQIIASNADWRTNANANDIIGSGYSPSDNREAALLVTLEPGPYTVIVSSEDSSQGVGLVEVYEE